MTTSQKSKSSSWVRRQRGGRQESHFSVSDIICAQNGLRIIIKYKILTIYNNLDPPLPLPSKKFDPDVKKENEMLRTFRVKISNIEITNETKEVLDPFLRIIFGGGFFTELKKKGKDETIYIHQG